MEPIVKRCVVCTRQNYKKQTGGHGGDYWVKTSGHYLRYIYDKEDKDYCCSECYDLIRRVVHNNGYYDDLSPPKGETWLKETQEFEASLDHSWTATDIDNILDAEEKIE